jgi:hypothetical protein
LSQIECLTAEDEPISPLPELPVAQDDVVDIFTPSEFENVQEK